MSCFRCLIIFTPIFFIIIITDDFISIIFNTENFKTLKEKKRSVKEIDGFSNLKPGFNANNENQS